MENPQVFKGRLVLVNPDAGRIVLLTEQGNYRTVEVEPDRARGFVGRCGEQMTLTVRPAREAALLAVS